MNLRMSGSEVELDHLLALASARRTPEADLAASRTGGHSGLRRGQGGDIFDLRPFQEGDDLRHIDPAATARSGRVQVRNRHEEVDRTTILLADFRRPMLWGTRGRFRSVAAAEALAKRGWQTVAAGGRAGLVAFSDLGPVVIAPQRRRVAMLAVAQAMVRCHAAARGAPRCATGTLDAAVEHATRLAPARASVLLATGLDLPGAGLQTALEALARKCRLHVLLVQDAVETAPPRGVFPVALDGGIAWRRFGASAGREWLAGLGIPVSVLRADRAEEVPA